MSALSDYVDELKRQADLLSEAEHRDEWALELIGKSRPGQRRIWTRQDANRLDCECQSAMLTRPIDPAALEEIWRGVRADTRVWRILRRLQEPSTDQTRREVLAANMPYVLPLIDAVRKAHARLVEFYRERILDWPDVQDRHHEAVEALATYADAETTPVNRQKKIKPTPRTLQIIRLLEQDRSNEQINEATGASVGNVRKVRSLFNRGGYKL